MIAGIAVVMAAVVLLWGNKAAIEAGGEDTIDAIVTAINSGGPFAARGMLGSELSFANEQWKKTLGLFDREFVVDAVVFSHATRNPSPIAERMNVFIAKGGFGAGQAALEVGLADQRLVYWKIRSFERALLTDEMRSASCARYRSGEFMDQPEFDLDPPWSRFPRAERYSPEWFEPEQSTYLQAFAKRWSRLDESQRDAYIGRYPPPEAWSGWYDVSITVWPEDCEASI